MSGALPTRGQERTYTRIGLFSSKIVTSFLHLCMYHFSSDNGLTITFPQSCTPLHY